MGDALKFYKSNNSVKAYQPKRKTNFDKPISIDEIKHHNFPASTQWRKLRRLFLQEYPLCGQTDKEAYQGNGLAKSCGNSADQVHHIIDRAEAPELAYDWRNLQSLCQSCHSLHTRSKQLRGDE